MFSKKRSPVPIREDHFFFRILSIKMPSFFVFSYPKELFYDLNHSYKKHITSLKKFIFEKIINHHQQNNI
jgi:hypothetical protein